MPFHEASIAADMTNWLALLYSMAEVVALCLPHCLDEVLHVAADVHKDVQAWQASHIYWHKA